MLNLLVPVPAAANWRRGCRRAALFALALPLLACETVHGPTSFTLTPEDVERRIEADLGGLFEVFRGAEPRRPQVTLMPISGRLQLDWNVTLPGAGAQSPGLFGQNGVSVGVAVSGRPDLNEAGNAIVLRDMRLEDVRVSGVPRLLGFGLGQLTDRKGEGFPDIPLFALPPGQLRRFEVAYEATRVEVTYRGLRIGIAPR
jgi:hypothetical protein